MENFKTYDEFIKAYWDEYLRLKNMPYKKLIKFISTQIHNASNYVNLLKSNLYDSNIKISKYESDKALNANLIVNYIKQNWSEELTSKDILTYLWDMCGKTLDITDVRLLYAAMTLQETLDTPSK